ncbi:alpha/beta-hydrolase [Hesseltinella vesiculosa]|uniref:triacylglycerol lipase n=1 Tax=Hesseltinella vesiculosa TaxID=101127 RepID=A0A1X2GGP5_9FUNG|nr:alpha/beta-hydrolase [Hesseltinella vesiculosa]
MHTLYYLVLLCILLDFKWTQGAVPFQHSFTRNPLSVQLKSIYHHASSQSAFPGLFRRQDIPSSDAHFQLDGMLATYHRPTQFAIDYLVGQPPATSSLSYRPRRIRWQSLSAFSPELFMTPVDDLVPNIGDRDVLMALAIMTNNAYSDVENTTDWYDLGTPWQLNTSFGWKTDGVRGHVFANHDDSLLVISFKGTSAGLWTGGPTGEKDKINDNMLFSCCCARISRAWSTVCDCYNGNTYYCESECLENSIKNSELYYDNAMAIYLEVADQYPKATIWLVGHSLGGSLASLVGQTFGVPTVAFEAPGEDLASKRLHLPQLKDAPLWHFGHTADPIFVGSCNGPSSICWYGGFAMETSCHAGKVCQWDTVKDKGWRVDARTHRIKDVIDNILNKTEEFPLLPECLPQTDCVDCKDWHYYDRREDPFPTSSNQ